MKNDEKISKKIQEIYEESKNFCDYIKLYKNQCAYTDRMAEAIIEKSHELEQLYNENFSDDVRIYNQAKEIKNDLENIEGECPLTDEEVEVLASAIYDLHWDAADKIGFYYKLKREGYALRYVMQECGLTISEDNEEEEEE